MLKRMTIYTVVCIMLLCSISACDIADPDIPVTEAKVQEENTLESTQKTANNEEAVLVALEVGNNADSMDTGKHTSECAFWTPELTVRHQREDAPQKKVIHIDGISYEGIYEYSKVRIPETFSADYYRSADKRVEFTVNAETGKVISLFLRRDPDSLKEGDFTAEECLEAANNFASFFTDINEYVLTVEPGDILHQYIYRKHIKGIATGEWFIVSVATADGTPYSFSSLMLGAFTDGAFDDSYLTQSLDLLKSEHAEDVLDKKIKTIYADFWEESEDKSTRCSYEVDQAEFVVLPDNSCGMLYTVAVDIARTENGRDRHTGSLIQILVK